MVIVCESKTGFTKRYAEMLSQKTGMRAFSTGELPQINADEEIIFLGWMMAGKIKGLSKLKKRNIVAVCATGTGRTAEPDDETVISRNAISGTPFFYLRGGCFPLKQVKGMDRLLLTFFVNMLKKREEKDERTLEAIDCIENGFDGVTEENLLPVLEWLKSR